MTRHTKLIDHDIQECVKLLEPETDEQRVLLENSMQAKRNELESRWRGLVPGTLGRELRKDINFDRGSKDPAPTGPGTGGGVETHVLEEAQVVTSHLGNGLHAPVLDIDFECSLVRSSTPGHYHLYLDKPMTWDAYKALLDALADAAVIERGYADVSKKRGFSAARLPWVKKKKASASAPAPVPPF